MVVPFNEKLKPNRLGFTILIGLSANILYFATLREHIIKLSAADQQMNSHLLLQREQVWIIIANTASALVMFSRGISIFGIQKREDSTSERE